MALRDEIKAITGNKRKFLLLRVVDMDVKTAMILCGIKQGTYNTWCQNSEFVELYRRRDEFSAEYKQEAIQLLRRDNQLAAVLLEAKIVDKMKGEIESGVYELVKTNLAREVYSKLINDLDVVPTVQIKSWEQRVALLVGGDTPELEGGAVEGEFIETTGSEAFQHPQSLPAQESEQTPSEAEEKAEKG